VSITLKDLPKVRGRMSENVPLAPYTWLRVGGAADVLFMPADQADLAHFLSATSDDIPVHVLGAASNTLVRDGGVEGVIIRLGPAFGQVEQLSPTRLGAGAAVFYWRRIADECGLLRRRDQRRSESHQCA